MQPYVDPDVVHELGHFDDDEYLANDVFPPRVDLFAALRLCPYEGTRVLILGQDPYHKAARLTARASARGRASPSAVVARHRQGDRR